MTPTFVVYIDESGDEGFSFGRGSSEWFVLSGVITRKAHDLETVKLVDKVRARLGKPEKKLGRMTGCSKGTKTEESVFRSPRARLLTYEMLMSAFSRTLKRKVVSSS